MSEGYYKKLQDESNGEKRITADGPSKKQLNKNKMPTKEELPAVREAIR